MKMNMLFMVLSIFLFGGPFIPRSLDGFYHSEVGLTIHIRNKQAIITYSEGHSIIDTVSVCKITDEDENFIRIDSPSPYERVMSCIRFEESYSSDHDQDSVYVTFDFPIHNEEIWIGICDDKNTLIPSWDIKYPEQNQIVIPRSIPSLNAYSWGIRSNVFSLSSELFNLYVSQDLRCVFPITYRNFKTNVLHISVPCLDDGFFNWAQVKGEYIKVSNEGLIWRGYLFRRESERD